MDDTHHTAITSSKQIAPGWQANLTLDFANEAGRSYLAKRQHSGPLVIQKTLHPEGVGVCHGIIVHPPGGVAGGDQLTLRATLAPKAQALLTTPGAGKWYKANGQLASQHLVFTLQDQACLEWLPQENILYDGAQVKFSAEVHLAEQARFMAWEILCFGRQAQKEVWQTGFMHQNLAIYRQSKHQNQYQNQRIWQECARLSPQHRALQSAAGLAGNAVSASLVVAAGAVPASVLDACRAVQPKLASELHAKYGVTALPEIFSARYVGSSAQAARSYFEQLWQLLRPWYAGREATRPRIWNT